VEGPAPGLKLTSTGILSNRRPVTGVSASTSGVSTPTDSHRPNLLFTAKREAAKATLYARFHQGTTLAADEEFEETTNTQAQQTAEFDPDDASQPSKKPKKRRKTDDLEVYLKKKKEAEGRESDKRCQRRTVQAE